ncbi:NACHT, LRR and PYD domains-containing protein 1b allele 3-like [Clarias gariepinus]|uniref:NACHT, LRR and PYD domains-containing protein 1b allele 2-like n=1 Tax=Clarias gariepinus TaxID=13013 RepID=UPI00234CC84D|nr:NACHT, LRR and PYD domains-containing protein 1b allele 2-like [Clarias gariepinus]
MAPSAWDDEEEEEESSDSDDEEEGDDENDDEEEESSDSIDKEWTEDERMRMKKSALQTVSSVECYSSEVEEFSPELVKKCVDDNSKNKYRFQFPHAGQFKCKLTDLKFMMEREGEVVYSTVSWNSYPLDGLGQKEPAGPLYSIDCHKGLIKYLHLPHSKTSELEMNVAHMAGGYWEITQPLSVTNTHVIIDVEGLSLLGLIKTRPSNADPIEAQVLLFFKKNIGKNRKSKLHMYLLPGDVAAEEVQKKHGKKTHVETSGSCELTPDKKYEPFIKDNNLEFTVQPKSKKFKRDYSPNCQPTFEVIFKTEVDEITIGLLDERKEEVWSREVLLTNTEAASLQVNTAGADFMDQHRETLIQRVSSVMEIADCLKSKKRITDEMYNKMKVPSITSQDQMRLLYSAIDSGGKTVKEKVYKILKKKFPDIVNDLESA